MSRRTVGTAVVSAMLAWLPTACAGPGDMAPMSAESIAEIEQWKTERDESLRQEDGWLTLVGLFWLEEGANSLGSDPASDVIFPPTVPAHLGHLVVDGATVRLEAPEAAGIQHEGEVVTSLGLRTDTAEDPTILTRENLSFYVIERAGKLGVRIKDSEAAALKAFAGMDYFPLAAAWRLQASFQRFDPPKTIKVPNVLGTASEEPVPGVATFVYEGKRFELTPVGEPDEALFFVFGDATNGTETYGGGRFLMADAPSASGTIVLDFNRAYNPPCVFSPYATCPLPPPRNKLPIAIRAGEKSFGSAH